MWFWSTQIPSSFYRKLLIFFGFCLCAFILWLGIMEYSTRLLKERIQDVEKILKTQIGFPIEYSAIEPKWHWNSIVIALKDLVIIDNEVPIPFLKAKTLQLGSNPYRLLFNKEQPFNHLYFDGMKIVVGYAKGKDLSILGLNGEWFSSSFDYQALLKALSGQDTVTISDSEIHWLGPKFSLLQRIEGNLNWSNNKDLSWYFAGKQQLKLNQQHEFWPVSFINLHMDTPAKVLSVKVAMDRTKLALKLNFPKESKEPIYLDSLLEGKDIDLRIFHQNLGLTENDPEWLRWLNEAIERGFLTHGKIAVLGPLDNLTWHGDMDFKNLNLQYNKDWPKIRKANGTLKLEPDNIKIQVFSGNIMGAKLKQVDALIAPMGHNEDYPEIKVEGSLSGRLENGLQFLLFSPLKNTLGKHLSHLKPEGPMDLHLNLKIPLGSANKKQTTEVQGQLGVDGAEVTLDALELPMTNIKGLFRFTEKGMEAQGVTAELLDKPVKIEANPTRVTASTMVESEFLQEKIDLPVLSNFAGQTEIAVSYLNSGSEWVIESSLQGMSIDLPYPFGKKAEESIPSVLTIFPTEGKDSFYELKAKARVNAKWTMEAQNTNDLNGEASHLKRGHIVLGGAKDADWVTGNVLSISGEMPYLNVEEWKTFLDKGFGFTASSKGSNAAQKLSVQLNIFTGQLEAFGLTFKNTWLKHLTDNTAEWTLDGPTIKGSLLLPTSKNKQLQFSFTHLKLNSSQLESDHRTADDLLKNNDRIPITFNTQSLTFNDTWFGETSFRLLPRPYGYEIQELVVRNKSSRLEGRGEWRMGGLEGKGSAESSHLLGEVLSDNMSQTFAQWGFSSAMQEGRGRIQFNLQWPGSPFELNLKKAAGRADLKLRAGHILGMNPGLGKILGLLSLENLVTRRLQLDFSDVVKKGFVFDKLEANMEFKTGILETNNLFIDGPAAKVKISGVANLANKELDLQMLVIPKVGNTLPIAASLATGNPAIGVGVWVVDKLTGSKISQVSQRSYHVTGTWDAPLMNEVGKTSRGRGRAR